MLSNNHFFGASSQRRDIFWRCCIDMKLWEAYTYVYIYIIFILYLWLPVVSSNISISTFCNKDSHVIKKARWSCRRRNRLSCSSCGGNSETLFFLTKGFSRIYTGARHSWDILMADFYLDSRGLRLDNLNLFTMFLYINIYKSFFLSKTSDLWLKFIEQAKEQDGYLDTISKINSCISNKPSVWWYGYSHNFKLNS